MCLYFPPFVSKLPRFLPFSFSISFPLFPSSHSSFLCFKTSLPFQFQKIPLSRSKHYLSSFPSHLCFFFPFSPPSVLLCWVLFIEPSEWGFLPLRMGAGQAVAGRPLGATVEVRLQRHGASGWSVGSRRERPRQNLNKSSFFLLPRCMFGGRRKRNSISVSAPHSWPCVSLRSLVSDLCNLTLN